MTKQKTRNKKDARKDLRLTRPPRLENKVKEAKMQPKKKPKKVRTQMHPIHKPQQQHLPQERKELQLEDE